MLYYQWDGYVLIVGYIFILVVGVFMNFVSMLYFGFLKKGYRSKYRYFIAHLSFADLLCCFIIPILTIGELLEHGKWSFGEITCIYLHPIGRLSGLISAWILCGLTFERYRALTDPFKRFSTRAIHVFFVIIWSVALVFSFIISSSKKVSDGVCGHYRTPVTHYINIIKAWIKIVVPSLIMTVLYIRLSIFLKRQQKLRVDILQSTLPQKKSMKIILHSLILYLVTIFPTFICSMMINIQDIENGNFNYLERTKTLKSFVLLLYYSNSVFNVFIYAGRFKDFRKFIMNSLCLWRRLGRMQKISRIENTRC